jgi:hypothetical protein
MTPTQKLLLVSSCQDVRRLRRYFNYTILGYVKDLSSIKVGSSIERRRFFDVGYTRCASVSKSHQSQDDGRLLMAQFWYQFKSPKKT